jgi:hypothetical protein
VVLVIKWQSLWTNVYIEIYIWRLVPLENDWRILEDNSFEATIASRWSKWSSLEYLKDYMLRAMVCAIMDHDLERMIKEKNFTYGLKIGSWWAHMLSHGWLCLEASNSCEEFVVPLKRLLWSMKKNKWWPIWYSWINSIWSYDNWDIGNLVLKKWSIEKNSICPSRRQD